MKIKGLESHYAVFRAPDWRALHVLCRGARTQLYLRIALPWRRLAGVALALKL